MRWGTDVKTETPIDWVWGVGFEGRASRPIGRTAPGTGGGGGGGGGVVGIPPVAVISGISSPAAGPNYAVGEPIDVTVNSTDADGLVISQLVETVGENDSQSVAAGSQVVRLFAPGSHTSVAIFQIRLTATDDDGNSHKVFQAITVDPPATWTTSTFNSTVNIPGVANRFELTLQPSGLLPVGTEVKVTGLTGLNELTGAIPLVSIDGVFNLAGWDSATSTATLTSALAIPTGSDTFVTFDITNGSTPQTSVTPSLSAVGAETVVLTPTLEIIALADISNLIASGLIISDDGAGNALTQADIVALTAPVVYQLYWAANVTSLYLWDGAIWVEFKFN